jgi:4,5-DOPA dioxygenase extradiol
VHPQLLHGGFHWTQRFDTAARERLIDDPAETAALADHPDFRAAAPTTEHFIPMLYLAGLAAAGDGQTQSLVDGYAYGSLSMASYVLDGAATRV